VGVWPGHFKRTPASGPLGSCSQQSVLDTHVTDAVLPESSAANRAHPATIAVATKAETDRRFARLGQAGLCIVQPVSKVIDRQRLYASRLERVRPTSEKQDVLLKGKRAWACSIRMASAETKHDRNLGVLQ
jgi:hypothetical protein